MTVDKNNELLELTKSYKRLTKLVILTFGKGDLDVKNQILRNFIAKAHSLINSISILLKEEQEGEAMALYRLLIERFLYLEYLHKTNSYQEFKDWSFIKKFESKNKIRSNLEFNSPKTKEYLVDSKEQVKKYQALKKKKNQWIKPNIENLAKEIKYSFLYSLGYDSGSSFIHPNADEGFWDAFRIAKNEKMRDSNKNYILVNSMLLAYGMLLNAFNRSDLKFKKSLIFYCGKVLDYLDNGKELPDLKDIEKPFFANMIAEIKKNYGQHRV